MFAPDVIDLVAEWELRAARGEAVSPEMLCAGRPELLRELRACIDDLQRVNRALGTTPGPDARPPVEATKFDADLPDVPLEPGRLDHVRFHARGGLGEVYSAHDSLLNRQVALKTVQSRWAGDAVQLRRFTHEAEVTARLDHPGVVPVHARGHAPDGRPCFVMRFIEGESLRDAIERVHAAGPVEFRGSVFRQLLARFVVVCQTIGYAHSRGVLHRDLKPANVMLGRYGETLVVDWGLAKIVAKPEDETPVLPDRATDADLMLDTATSATAPGAALGTPAYMSPEQAAGAWDQLGPTSDVFGLGATLFHLLVGRAPYQGHHLEVLVEAQAGRFAQARAVNPAVPRALEAVAHKAMALRPRDRYATALDLAADVERWLADEPTLAWREPLPARVRRWVRRHAALTTGLAVALVTALGALSVGLVAVERQRQQTVRQRDRVRDAVHAMTSDESLAWLSGQQRLTDQQRSFLEQALAYYQEFAADAATDDDGHESVAHANLRVGTLLQKLRRFSDAEPPLRRATELGESLAARRPDVGRYRSLLVKAYTNLGETMRSLSRPGDSDAAYNRAHEFAAGLSAAAPDDAAALAQHATVLNSRGVLRQETRRLSESAADLRAALAIRQRLAARSPADRLDLARTSSNLGNTLDEMQDRPAAQAAYQLAIDILGTLAQEYPASREYTADLASACTNHAIALREEGRYADADVPLRRALAAYVNLLRAYPGLPEYREGLARVHNSHANNLDDLEKYDEAEASYRTALAVREELVREFPDVPVYRRDLGSTQLNMGIFVMNRRSPKESLPWFQSAIDLIAPLAERQPDLVIERRFLRNVYSSRGEAYERLDRWKDALADFDRALLLDAGEDPVGPRLGRATCLLALRQFTQATDEAKAVAERANLSGRELHDCAGVLAQAAEYSWWNRKAAESWSAQAVVLLRRAVVDPAVIPELLSEDFAVLRRRADFAALLMDVAEGTAGNSTAAMRPNS